MVSPGAPESAIGEAGTAGQDLLGRQLSVNLTRFGHKLHRLGIPVGTGRLIEALRALEVVEVTDPEEFYWTLYTVFVHRRDEAEIFDGAFHRFWRSAHGPGEVLLEALASEWVEVHGDAPQAEEAAAGQAEDAAPSPSGGEGDSGQLAEGEGAPGSSPHEAFKKKDFENMDPEEIAAARKIVARMRLAVQPLPTRRFRTQPRGQSVDLRATLRASVRAGTGYIPLQRRTRRLRSPPLVALCDISGSMRAYTRMLLYFLHALTAERERTHTFLFGTRLTNATPYLRRKDPDLAMRQLGDAVLDWEGGTRIGASIAEFNRVWSRRVLSRGAVVLLITDGLDQEGGEGLNSAMRRLHDSCRRLVWLNPLLRFEDFEPQSAGIRAMIGHVDYMKAVHNLESLEQLAEVLGDLDRPLEPLRWRYRLELEPLRIPVPALRDLWVPREQRPHRHQRGEPPPPAG